MLGHSQFIWFSVPLCRFFVLNLLPLLQYCGLLPLLLEGHRPCSVKAGLRHKRAREHEMGRQQGGRSAAASEGRCRRQHGVGLTQSWCCRCTC